MKTIDVDDELYLHLEKSARFGEMPNDLLRRLMKLPPVVAASTAEVRTHGKLTPLLMDEAFRKLNPTEKSLKILATAHREKGEKAFERLLQCSGRRRKYFAQSATDIEASGTSTHPRPIPETGFWMMTNTDTPNKKLMVMEALTKLGYSRHETVAAGDAILSST